jgi:hypothetical protein
MRNEEMKKHSVQISCEDTLLIRLAIVKYGELVEKCGYPRSELQKQAKALADALVIAADNARDIDEGPLQWWDACELPAPLRA